MKKNAIKYIFRYFAILLFSGVLAMPLHAQKTKQTSKKPSKEALQQQAQRLEEQIKTNNRLLEETSKNKTANVTQLNILTNQIQKRDKLINTINGEISVVNAEIRHLENEINSQEKEIRRLKNEYAKLVVATQRHVNPSDQLLFVVASENFNQAYRRIRYFQQYSEHRKQQVNLIHEKQAELTKLKTALESEKVLKTNLLSKEEKEKKNLSAEKTKRDKTISDLQKKEKQLRADINKQKAEQKRLSQQIERIIQQEVEAARKAAAKRAAEEAKKSGKPAKPAAPDVTQLTPAEQKLADDFVSNRGRLPWPTERGVITEQFGTHAHPVIKGAQTTCDGIEITTSPNEPVRAVFGGTVVGIYPMPYGDAKTVIIVHGNYRTVYINLKSVSVKAGQKVTTKQQIGVVNTYDGKNYVKFQIWRDLQKLNPEQWIASK